VLRYTGERAGVQSLHQKSADAANEGSEITVNDPWRIARFEKPAGFTLADGFKPRRNTLRVTREQAAKLDREKLLNAIVF
jgi:hypothetical protein